MDNDTKKMIAGYLRSYDADQLINDILEVLEKEEQEEDSLESQSEAVFSHNISNRHIGILQSQLHKARDKETLGQYLRRVSFEKGIREYSVKVFGEAQISDKYWYKLLGDKYPNPRKDPLLRVAIAMKLNLLEGMRLLRRAGMTLSGNNMKDAVVAYCLDAGIYDFADIEEVLAENGIQTLFTNQREITKRKEKSKERKAKKVKKAN
ncbi:hypothetical protein [Alicyclobacillus acidiphilus]|uniref:hypothetical protein n=1 Tax=Alicyclobacillus acidiphilus TaxID=182455 RepID=UPI00082A8E1A|nr:hypothetical protein [Alicyclobacillus acidiphilus]